MYSNFTVDYLTFSLRPEETTDKRLCLGFIVDLLGLKDEFYHFEHVGGRNGYASCYVYNDVLIHVPSEEHYARMGFCVMMKGNGLRWYAGLFPQFSIYEFLTRLVDLTKNGFPLNISRIDIALDDRAGLLDLDVISKKANNFEFVSTSRTRQTVCEYINHKGDVLTGKTLYFGSRQSQAYVRIYDKAAEQGVSGHWVRVEYEFKQETAMRLANAMIRTWDEFPAYFCGMANRYLRFIELDDSNRSRCSVSDFWAKFLDTVQTIKLSIQPYKKNTLTKLLSHVIHSYAPSLVVLLRTLPQELLLNMLERAGTPRLKQKHFDMIENPNLFTTPFSSSERWGLEVPTSVYGQQALAGV